MTKIKNQIRGGVFTLYRTDLACERKKARKSQAEYAEKKKGNFSLHSVKIKRPCKDFPIKGQYHSLFFPSLSFMGKEEKDALSSLLSALLESEAKRLLSCDSFAGMRVLFIGLGNAAIAADSLGPQTASYLHPTAHLQTVNPTVFDSLDCAAIAAFCPGVTAETGLTEKEELSAIASAFSPDFVLLCDSLATKSPDRLCKVFQMTDAAVFPGAGLGGRGVQLDAAFFGCPILALGLACVCDTSSFLLKAPLSLTAKQKLALKKQEKYFVTSKDVDLSVRQFARLLGEAVNFAFGVPEV